MVCLEGDNYFFLNHHLFSPRAPNYDDKPVFTRLL